MGGQTNSVEQWFSTSGSLGLCEEKIVEQLVLRIMATSLRLTNVKSFQIIPQDQAQAPQLDLLSYPFQTVTKILTEINV